MAGGGKSELKAPAAKKRRTTKAADDVPLTLTKGTLPRVHRALSSLDVR